MSTIFDNFNGDVDLSIFRKSNTDPKTPLRRHYLSLVGLLEYVDILNGDLTGRSLPEGMDEDTVKRMVSHCIGDLDTMKAMSTGGDPGPEPEQHDYVDLGLPSGTLWATENIKDANGNELYFAWGGTQGYTAEQVGNEEGKRAFTWDDYEFGPDSALTRYNDTDGKTVLDSIDDAATQNWGEGWKMPTEEQFRELIANTNQEWTEVDGVQGAKFTSKVKGHTDKFLFFPAVGCARGGEVYEVGGYGHCWSVSLDDGEVFNAWYFSFAGGLYVVSDDCRCYGYSVRPVRLQNQ